MLVLSRKLGEKIYIGENICITIVDIDRGKVRLGIEAPRDVLIMRQELLPPKPAHPPLSETHPCEGPQGAEDAQGNKLDYDDP